MQPGFRHFPIALDSCRRHSQTFRSFFNRQPAKIAQLNNLLLLFIHLSKTRQCFVQIQTIIVGLLNRDQELFIEVQILRGAAALFTPSGVCVIDEDTTHEVGGDRKKVLAILPTNASLFDQL